MSTPDQTNERNAVDEQQSDDEFTRQFYVNSLMDSVDKIRRKSFRRLILLAHVIEYEAYEYHGEAWDAWVAQKDEHVSPTPSNFYAALDVQLVRKMRPSAADFCSEDDVEFLYGVSNETLREYIRTVTAILS